MGPVGAGVEPQRFTILDDRLVQFSMLLQGGAEVIVGLEIVGPDMKCGEVLGYCIAQLAVLSKGVSEIVMGLRVVGLKAQRGAIFGDRFLQFPVVLQGEAKAVVSSMLGRMTTAAELNRMKSSGLSLWPSDH